MSFRPDQRASLVTLATADLVAATAFYRDGLGWTPAFGNDEVTFFQLNGWIFGLWDRARMSQELGIPEPDLGPGGMELAYNVREPHEVEAFLDLARAAGGRVVSPAKQADWGGRTGHFADLDGHRWEVAWNPTWQVTADGRTLASFP